MSELPNLIWVVSLYDDWNRGPWSADPKHYNGSTAYVPASELEQAQDKLAEYGEGIARLRELLNKTSANNRTKARKIRHLTTLPRKDATDDL